MSDSKIDIGNYKSEVVEQKSFDDQNKGKPLLNTDDEYVFTLIKFPHGYTKKDEKKNADGSITTVLKTMAVCEFEEKQTKNIVTTQFRIDKLNFGSDEKFRSGVVKFFQKLGLPLTENKIPDWKEHFVVGMRFRGRVVVKGMKDKDNNDVTKYYLDVPTVRKLLASDTVGETFTSTETAPNDILLATALKITQGCENAMDATNKLFERNSKTEVVQAFLAANKAGKITFPIQ
jgi:hypothetical protein